MIALFLRDIRLSWRAGGGALTGVMFFLAVVMVVPFGVGPDLNLLARIGPAMLWLGALLAALLGLDRLFQADREDGSLDLLIMNGAPMAAIVFIKCLAHWVTTGLPLVIAVPLFGLFMNMEPLGILATMATLMAGTPAITFVGAVGAAVTVSLPRGGLLLAVLVLPWTIPVLIFGVSAAYGAVEDPAPFTEPFIVLCAISLFFAVIGSLGAGAILTHSDH